MTNDIAIRIRGLGKSYTIVHDERKATNLGEAITNRLRNPLHRPQKETFWALRDVDLDIRKGEVVGIIGRNGAGKSTLLKVLSRITEPTTGQVDLYGRVGSLLEVGTGFHPELTGRENIFLNGAILGMKRGEIRKQYDAIVDFAGVEKFLDTPVKRYSSGMYVRLAFAVAAHLNPEILLVDEVLAVGDAEFQKKCLGKMKDVAEGGRTVILVSHNMAAIRRLCHTVVLLRDGQLQAFAATDQVVNQYVYSSEDTEESSEVLPICNRVTGASIERCEVSVHVDGNDVTTVLSLRVHLSKAVSNLGIGLHITSMDGYRLARLLPGVTGLVLGPSHGTIDCRVEMPMLERHLAAGNYIIGISLHELYLRTLLEADDLATLRVPEIDLYGTGRVFDYHHFGPLPLEIRIVSHEPNVA